MPKYISHTNIIIPATCRPWPHEIRTALALADYGFKLTFIPESDTAKTPDVLIENRQYEMKAPISSHIEAVERNLKIASKKTKIHHL